MTNLVCSLWNQKWHSKKSYIFLQLRKTYKGLFWLAPLQLVWVYLQPIHKYYSNRPPLHHSEEFKCFSILDKQTWNMSGVETWINKSWQRSFILNCLCSDPFRVCSDYDSYHIRSCSPLMKHICPLSGILWSERWTCLQWRWQKLLNQLTFTITY